MNSKFIVLGVFVVCATAHMMNVKDDPVIFVPHPLPCAFEITTKQTTIDMTTGEHSLDATIVYYGHGTYYKRHGIFNIVDKGNDESEVLIRTDLAKQYPDVFAVSFEAYNTSEDCDMYNVSEEGYYESIEDDMVFLTENITCDTVEYVDLWGQRYKMYTLDDGDCISKFYTDEDNYVMRVELIFPDDKKRSGGANSTYIFQYKFTSSLSSFVINKSVCSHCADEAYTAPTESLCPDPSSSSSSIRSSSISSSSSNSIVSSIYSSTSSSVSSRSSVKPSTISYSKASAIAVPVALMIISMVTAFVSLL